MTPARRVALVVALLPATLAAEPYAIALDAAAHGAPLAPCTAPCTSMVQEVARGLGEAPDPDTHLRVHVGALERATAPPGIGFQFGNPQPDVGRGSVVPQAVVRCEVLGAGNPGTHSVRLALPEPTALERLAGRGGPTGPQRYAPAIADACARALRMAGLKPARSDFRSAVVVVSPGGAGAPASVTPAPDSGPVLRRAASTPEALDEAAPGDVIFEFGQRR